MWCGPQKFAPHAACIRVGQGDKFCMSTVVVEHKKHCCPVGLNKPPPCPTNCLFLMPGYSFPALRLGFALPDVLLLAFGLSFGFTAGQ